MSDTDKNHEPVNNIDSSNTDSSNADTNNTNNAEIAEKPENIEITETKNYKSSSDDTTYKNTIYKSEGITLVMSIVLGLIGINGTGHLYLGKIKRGIIILVGSLICFVVMFGVLAITIELWSPEMLLLILAVSCIGYITLFIYQIVDARRLCKIYNKEFYERGISHW